MYQDSFFNELIIDNFAGGGGASVGIELAAGRPVDIAINHDADAFALHFGTYTDKDTVNVLDVFKLLDEVAKEMLEGNNEN